MKNIKSFPNFILFSVILLTAGCQSSKIVAYTHGSVSNNNEATTRSTSRPCYDPLQYLPDTIHKEVNIKKRLRINWHCVDDTIQNNNFTLKDMGYFVNLTNNANYRLIKNFKMDLPIGNNTAVYDPHLEWVISPSKGYEANNGLYHHVQRDIKYFVNKGVNRSDYDNTVIKQLGIGLDTICNVFVVPFPPDSTIKSTAKMNQSGIALGNHIKLGGLKQGKKPDWEHATLLSHEIGHVLGLSHAWHEDGCNDTPNNPNCWNKSTQAPCDKLVSNNLMDYNSQQMAITPCQIGKMHMVLNDTLASQRKLAIPDWCKHDVTQQIIVRDSMSWLGWRDVDKSIIVEPGGVLMVCCRLGMPRGSYIQVKIGGTLILQDVTLHNDCGHKWQGIFIEKKGSKSGTVIEQGRVKIVDVGSVR